MFPTLQGRTLKFGKDQYLTKNHKIKMCFSNIES